MIFFEKPSIGKPLVLEEKKQSKAAFALDCLVLYSKRPISYIVSAICNEFQAAPFSKLSETTHK